MPVFNKLSHPRDDWKLFCELASPRQMIASGFCDKRNPPLIYLLGVFEIRKLFQRTD